MKQFNPFTDCSMCGKKLTLKNTVSGTNVCIKCGNSCF